MINALTMLPKSILMCMYVLYPCRFDFCVTNISFTVDIIQMFHSEVTFLVPIRFIR